MLYFHLSFSIFAQDIVNAICDDEDIKAVSFVGPDTVSSFSALFSVQVKQLSIVSF